MRKIGIIGAMEGEIAHLKNCMNISKVTAMANINFYEGILSQSKIVIARSGIGKVNAAMCTQILIDVFHVDVILNTGVAGSLQAGIRIGDIVLSTDLVQHDIDATSIGYPPGKIPGMDTASFAANTALRIEAYNVSLNENPGVHVFCGRIASGDSFISSQEKRDYIASCFRAVCAEMEGQPSLRLLILIIPLS